VEQENEVLNVNDIYVNLELAVVRALAISGWVVNVLELVVALPMRISDGQDSELPLVPCTLDSCRGPSTIHRGRRSSSNGNGMSISHIADGTLLIPPALVYWKNEGECPCSGVLECLLHSPVAWDRRQKSAVQEGRHPRGPTRPTPRALPRTQTCAAGARRRCRPPPPYSAAAGLGVLSRRSRGGARTAKTGRPPAPPPQRELRHEHGRGRRANRSSIRRSEPPRRRGLLFRLRRRRPSPREQKGDAWGSRPWGRGAHLRQAR
jgi:hypothetical protein